MKKGIETSCFMCGVCFSAVSKTTKDSIYRTGRCYCSKECSDKYRSKISSETAARTNRKYASERMKKRNPMRLAASREKMRDTLKSMGHKPHIRGGNGQPMPLAQKILSEILGWEIEFPVPTKKQKGTGYPTCYKIDLASPALKIGIELDGASHSTILGKERDAKKEELLFSMGWTIIRFPNRMVESYVDECLKMVRSVEDARRAA